MDKREICLMITHSPQRVLYNEAQLSELGGVAECCQRLQVPRTTFRKWQQRYGTKRMYAPYAEKSEYRKNKLTKKVKSFPLPVLILVTGPIWFIPDIVHWEWETRIARVKYKAKPQSKGEPK